MRHLFDSPLGVNTPLGVPKNVLGVGAAALAAGIAATASTASTIYNNYQANLANDEAYERTKELQQMQYDQQKELYEHQFNRESAYNDPSHLRKLYEKAGYNPALLAHNGDIGQAATHPAMPGVPSISSFGPRQVFPMDLQNGVQGISQALALSSEIKKNDAESFEKIVRSLPELGKSIGWDNVRSVAKDLLGMAGVSGSQYERHMEALIKGMELENRSKQVRATLDETFGPQMAEQKWALGEQSLSESFARIGKMASDVKVNESTIKKLASDCIVNVANAWKLRKEGEKYVADAKTINALRSFLVSQARSKANMMNTQSYLMGAEEGTDIFDYVHSGKHAKGVTGRLDIQDEFGDRSVFWIDRLLNQYVKILGSAPSGGSQTTTYYGFE